MPYRKRRERRQKKEKKNMKRKEAISCEGNRNPLYTQHSHIYEYMHKARSSTIGKISRDKYSQKDGNIREKSLMMMVKIFASDDDEFFSYNEH